MSEQMPLAAGSCRLQSNNGATVQSDQHHAAYIISF